MIQTRTAQMAQTVAAQAIGAAETAAVEGLAELETRISMSVDNSPQPFPHFTVDTDLTVSVSISGMQLDMAIAAIRPDSPLIGLGADFVQVGNNLGINPIYIAAHAAWESSWGTSALARNKNNLFGYGAYDSCPYECAFSFNTQVEGIQFVMNKIKVDYLTPEGQYYNGPNLRGMNLSYATDPNWSNGIASIMNSLAAKATK
ncbi:MAG: hypothetical protein Fur0021_24860 [Candidatus Promineifilaceae bacterium]